MARHWVDMETESEDESGGELVAVEQRPAAAALRPAKPSDKSRQTRLATRQPPAESAPQPPRQEENLQSMASNLGSREYYYIEVHNLPMTVDPWDLAEPLGNVQINNVDFEKEFAILQFNSFESFITACGTTGIEVGGKAITLRWSHLNDRVEPRDNYANDEREERQYERREGQGRYRSKQGEGRGPRERRGRGGERRHQPVREAPLPKLVRSQVVSNNAPVASELNTIISSAAQPKKFYRSTETKNPLPIPATPSTAPPTEGKNVVPTLVTPIPASSATAEVRSRFTRGAPKPADTQLEETTVLSTAQPLTLKESDIPKPEIDVDKAKLPQAEKTLHNSKQSIAAETGEETKVAKPKSETKKSGRKTPIATPQTIPKTITTWGDDFEQANSQPINNASEPTSLPAAKPAITTPTEPKIENRDERRRQNPNRNSGETGAKTNKPQSNQTQSSYSVVSRASDAQSNTSEFDYQTMKPTRLQGNRADQNHRKERRSTYVMKQNQ